MEEHVVLLQYIGNAFKVLVGKPQARKPESK